MHHMAEERLQRRLAAILAADVVGLGPQIGLTYLPWEAAATFKWAHELGAEDRFEGDNFTLNFAVAL
jgi:hypothetical protein